MPLPIDERWEYFMPDPEIAEVMGLLEPVEPSFDLLGVEERKMKKTEGLLGFRFGNGNPDAYFPTKLKLARPPSSKVLDPKRCKCCEIWFEPTRSVRVYCSRSCRTIDLHRRRLLVAPKKPREKKPRPRKADYDTIGKMYLDGLPMKEIAERNGLSLPSIKRIVRGLDIPRRPSGRKGSE